ncbi:titin, partial [Asbolus verrucosus]
MELKYVVLTIIKILISVPGILLYQSILTDGATLMGGHFDNKNSSVNSTDSEITDYHNNQEIITNSTVTSEEIPNPSPLVLPGYNLPENIFNKGKPFYLEKDPLTGKVDFDSKTSSLKLDDDLYDYVEEEPGSNIYDKANIDRKDGSLGSHRPSDVNQLTPNFHDFLNLPVKYNSDKYVYPLISSSYANTKIQGNVNKYYNHKDYNVKTSTYKPTVSPTYYSSTKNYFSESKTTPSTTTTTTTTTPKTTTPVYLTSTFPNLMNSPINHPSFHEDFEDYYDETEKPSETFSTTKNIDNIYLTTKAPTTTTTRRIMSIFEQLFGDYEETIATTEKPKSPPLPSLFTNLALNKSKTKYDSEVKTEKPSYTTPSHQHFVNSHAGPNILSGSNMGLESNSYEYEDEYSDKLEHEDSLAVESKPLKEIQITEKSTVFTEAPTTISTKLSTVSSTVTTTTQPSSTKSQEYFYDYNYENKDNQTVKPSVSIVIPTKPPTSTVKVTSLPLGENHVSNLNNRQPIIVATQNLREQLNNERVLPRPFGFEKPAQQPPSTSNVHIAPDQDMVSFVVGNHQNVDGGQYVGTSLKESPYDSNPFRPLYGQQAEYSKDTVSYTIQTSPEVYKPIQNFPAVASSSVTIQPQKNSEASLAIGVPVSSIKQVPGQVVDEKLEIDNEKIEFPKGTGTKVVFPDDKMSTAANLLPPPPQPLPPTPNREVLQLNSKPMYHQLPSDLTPPKEKEVIPLSSSTRLDRPRPPWDPRPGHFHSGKPEYVRPPRPPPEIPFRRIDNLPNILPQFRPNVKPNGPPLYLNRQPLLDRPSNRPVGFFEKLQPPPPPKNLHNLRKIPPPPQTLEQIRPAVAEDRIINEAPKKPIQDHFSFYQTPPKVVLQNRRIANLDGDVETLQMIQAKKAEKKDILVEVVTDKNDGGTDKPLYVVYPVNTPPIKLDVMDANKKENVVIGTRAELPLPPSKIGQNFDYEQNPILNPKDRNDAPVLKPHPRPTFPIKSDFPYPLERPDPSVLNPAVPETPSNNGNNLDESDNFVSSNQWNTIGENIESRIVTGLKSQNSNQISVTLKTYTEKPIAVAYTPTEPHDRYDPDKYSMPNYASPVIPEIRLGTADNAEIGHGKPDNEFTVSAVMHTHPQIDVGIKNKQKYPEDNLGQNHKSDTDASSIHQLDFQAPFQASVNIDSMSQGWSVVRDKNKSTTEIGEEVTTLPLATTSEFDIENFKPQLIGGFKPIYNFPEEPSKVKDAEVSEREE